MYDWIIVLLIKGYFLSMPHSNILRKVGFKKIKNSPYELNNKHVILEFSMLLTLQLYFDSFFHKSIHNSKPNIDLNFGIQPVTFI